VASPGWKGPATASGTPSIEVATAASSDEVRSFVITNFTRATNLLDPAYQAFQVPEESGGIPVVIPYFVNSAHDHNLQVHIWTINDEEDMRRFLDMDVDGIMTDRPDLLLDILGRS
jgi:glycerophosphoryl diester phosphodiesterase